MYVSTKNFGWIDIQHFLTGASFQRQIMKYPLANYNDYARDLNWKRWGKIQLSSSFEDSQGLLLATVRTLIEA
jgi:hypothetical protein